MYKFKINNLSVENFQDEGNNCFTPCLVDEISPYYPTQQYIQTGRDFKLLQPKSLYEVAKEDQSENFTNIEHFKDDSYRKLLYPCY